MKNFILKAQNKKLKTLLKTDFEKKKKKKERHSYSRFFFFFFKYIIVIRCILWQIVSDQIANKLFQKARPMIKQIIAFKINWIKKNFSVKKSFQFKQREMYRISMIIQYSIINLLKLFGSIFFINLFPYFKIFKGGFFEPTVFDDTNSFLWRLTRFMKTSFFSKFHYIKSDLFLKINFKVLVIADEWLLYDNSFLEPFPWWRRFGIRECELEFVCENAVSTICTTSRRKIF